MRQPTLKKSRGGQIDPFNKHDGQPARQTLEETTPQPEHLLMSSERASPSFARCSPREREQRQTRTIGTQSGHHSSLQTLYTQRNAKAPPVPRGVTRPVSPPAPVGADTIRQHLEAVRVAPLQPRAVAQSGDSFSHGGTGYVRAYGVRCLFVLRFLRPAFARRFSFCLCPTR